MDWNHDKEAAVMEINDFVKKYLSDLNLRNAYDSFIDMVDILEPVCFSGYTSVETWIKFWEYYNTCDSSKLSKATTNPEFPPDFPPLDYYTLNKVVFHYLLDIKLIEEARTFALHISVDNPDYMDYTIVKSVRKFIVPFTAYISKYSPNSKDGETFLFPSLIEDNVDEYIRKEQPRPPCPNGNSPMLSASLGDQQKVTKQCQPLLQLPGPEIPKSFLNMNPQLKRILPWLQVGSNYMPQLGLPSSVSRTGGTKVPELDEQRMPPPPPKEKSPGSSPNLDRVIDLNVKSLLPTEMEYIPQPVVPSSSSSLERNFERKPPQPKGKPSRPPLFLDGLIDVDVNFESFLPKKELDFNPVPVPVEITPIDSSLTLTQQLPESQLPHPCPQPKSS